MSHATECHVQLILGNYVLTYLAYFALPLSHFTSPYPICFALAPLCLAPKKPNNDHSNVIISIITILSLSPLSSPSVQILKQSTEPNPALSNP
jgi:hypothetical protein